MQKLVILNPGHFPDLDSGAVGNGLRECDITLKIVNYIVQQAPKYNFKTVIIHENELYDIYTKANQYDADLFISIHINSATNPKATGFETFTFGGSEKTENIRNIIHTKLASFFNYHGYFDRGQKFANFSVLKNTNMPAILTENLFINNPKDAEFLANDKNLENLADIYCQAIAEALGIEGNENMEEKNNTPSSWAKEAVEKAVNKGFIKGDENGNLMLQNSVTREQLMVFFNRLGLLD